MKKELILVAIVLLLSGSFFRTIAQEPILGAEINPEYQKWMDGKKSSVQYSDKALGLIPNPLLIKTKLPFSLKSELSKGVFAAPSFDLRITGGVTSVKNQGSCGSCWAFAAMGSTESNWLIAGNGSFDLSEDNLNTCHTPFIWTPCAGGNANMASACLTRGSGPFSETDDPYSASHTTVDCPAGLTPRGYVTSNWFLPAEDPDLIKNMISQYGALYTTFRWDASSYNPTDHTFYYSGEEPTNHAVTLVGWDDNKVTAGGTGAWIIKNSWGQSWGEGGYFYISYYDTQVNSSLSIFKDYLVYDPDQVISTYSEAGCIGHCFGFNSESSDALIKFIANENIILTKIGTYTSYPGSIVTIEVYDDFNGTNSLTGLLGSVTSKTCNFTGYHSFDLSSPVNISEGNDYFIKINYQSPGYNYPVPIESPVANYSNPSISKGIFWAKSSTVTSWMSLDNYSWDPCVYVYSIKNKGTAGNTEVYSLSSTTANRRAQTITFGETGIIQSISIFHNGGTGRVLLGVYSDSEGVPAARLGLTPATTINPAAGWQTVSLTNPVAVTAGQKVWLSWVFENNPGVRYREGTPARAQSPALWSGAMPDPFGASTFANYKYSVHCNYITTTPSVKLTSPNGGEKYYVGSTQTITWEAGSNVEVSLLYYSTNGGNSFNMIDAVGQGITTYDWKVPQTPSTECIFEVIGRDVAGTFRDYDLSDATFEIMPAVKVTSPNGGEELISGSVHTITWTVAPHVEISLLYYSINGGSTYTNIGGVGQGITSFEWTVPDTPSEQCRIEVIGRDAAGTFSSYDLSDGDFTIRTNSLTKTNGITEVYGLSSTTANRRAQTITFTEAGTIQSISIYHNGGTGQVLLGVYTDASGVPGARLGVTPATTINSSASWQTVSLSSPVTVTSGQKIWLSWVFENNPGIRYISGTPARAQSTALWSGGMPDPFGSSSFANYRYSVYCTYTTGGAVIPSLTTAEVASVTKVTAQSGGNVTNDGGSAITARGVCWSTSHDPTVDLPSKTNDGTGTGIFTSSITGLSSGITYYLRAYATNSTGTSYGDEITFTTYNADAIEDTDGNYYNLVKIGSQIWLAENLRTTKYNDRASIPLVTSDVTWNDLTTDAYCWYKNDEASYKDVYGALYNWNSVNTQKLCPAGWHVPSDAEWHTLALAIDPDAVLENTESLLGGKLKETETEHWASPNTGATNESGFTALPGGNREDNIPGGYDPTSNFEALGIGGCWWTSTEYNSDIAWYRNLGYNTPALSRLAGTNQSKRYGYSVRCIKDTEETKTNGITEVYSLSSTTANRRAQTITFTEAGTIQSISIYHNGGTGQVLLGVYADAAGVPGARLGVTSATTINSIAGWQEVSLTSPVAVTSGQKVWLSWVFQNNPGIRYISGTPARAQSTTLWSGGMPDPFGSSSLANYRYSVYCTYIPGGIVTKTNGITEVYSLSSTTANRRAQTITFTEAGTIQSISIYHNGGTGQVLLGVYADASGVPGPRLGVTPATNISSSAGWQTVSLTSTVTVNSGQKVWLSWVFENNPGIRYISGTPARAQSTALWPGGMPDPFGSSSLANYRYSVYCTYTTSAGDEIRSVNEPLEASTLYREEEEVLIYPNPASDHFMVTWKNRYDSRLVLTIYDIQGRPVKKLQIEPDVNEIQVDLGEIRYGIYLFELKESGNNMIIKRSTIIKY